MKKAKIKILLIILIISFVVIIAPVSAKQTTKVTGKLPNHYENVTLFYGEYTKLFGEDNLLNAKYTKDGHWALCTRLHQSNKPVTTAKECVKQTKGWSANKAISAGVANIIMKASNSPSSATPDSNGSNLGDLKLDNNNKNYYYAEIALNKYLYNLYYDSQGKLKSTMSNYDIKIKDKNGKYYPEVSILNKPDKLNNTKVNNIEKAGENAYYSTKNFEPSIEINQDNTKCVNGSCTASFTVIKNKNAVGSGDKWTSYNLACNLDDITFVSSNGSLDLSSTISHKNCSVGADGTGTVTFDIPASGIGENAKWKIGFKVSITRKFFVAQNYRCGDNVQTITPNALEVETEKKLVSKKATVKLKSKHTSESEITYDSISCAVKLNKVSSVTDKLLSGSQFRDDQSISDDDVLDIDNEDCYMWADTATIGNSLGSVLTETIAPRGYKPIVGNYSFSEVYDGSTINVKIPNEADTSILLKKVDPKGNRVKGADLALIAENQNGEEVIYQKFVYLNENEVPVSSPDPHDGIALAKVAYDESKYDSSLLHDRWTSSAEYDLKFIEIPYKTSFKIAELKVPEGYVNDPVSESYEFDDANELDKHHIQITLLNYKSEVSVSKRDITNDQELPGAHMVLFKETQDGEYVVDSWISEDKPHKIYNLPNGNYYIRETSSPEGYELNTVVYNFEIVNGTVEKPIIIYNTPTKVTIANTLLNKKIITYILGGILILGGAGVLGYELKKRKVFSK